MSMPPVHGDPPVASGPELELIVPGGHGRAFEMLAGQYLTIVNVEGCQIGDFVAFNARDVTEHLHAGYSRMSWGPTEWGRTAKGRLYPRVGDVLISNLLNPMLEIVLDDVGQHDLTRAMCTREFYERYFGLPDHRSCHENVAEALEPYGVARWWMPMPFNIFQNTPVQPDGSYELLPSPAKPGDRIVMRAHMGLFCGLSACPADTGPQNCYKLTDLKVIVQNAAPSI